MLHHRLCFFAALAGLAFATSVCPAGVIPVDLNSGWALAGPAGNGNWQVALDGKSVLQTTNGNPTFFVSDADLFNTNIVGKFGVETGADDDFIGFVFGFQSADDGTGIDNDFLLFDWKQANQSAAEEGFALSRVQGTNTEVGDKFWNHDVGNPAFDVLATNQGPTLGWADNTVYDFDLLYTANRIKIDVGVAGGALQTIFDINGSFQSGRFGFYNYSQSAVRYQGFTEEAVPPPSGAVPEPSTILTFAGVLFAGMIQRRRRQNVSPASRLRNV
ncbi:hypothetical protein K227x_31290 [Rubripirellula lacrimiformis]|uniref:TSP C-terminal domain-containing protein n=1 Tax=Rubripirellula lacrimiformis TaxID=1930273 RepID=A0A517NC66_9BACT|nr:PEP-CTERM sorting domain-containing protein [Rubripirellula lacrimiformis]QDT04734.1 hypothetical protein K227x_31290 [Rubripirellula lacrimiformis]